MAEMEFSVICLGEILDGFDRDTVIQTLAKMFNQPPEKIIQLLDRPRSKLKSGLTEEKARQYVTALTRAGLKVVIDPPPAGTPPEGSVLKTALKSATNPENARERDLADEQVSALRFTFHGDGKEYFKIWIVNLLLSIVTLGIYSAWAKVRNKKYFYGNTQLDGSSFEYTGDPIAILKGRVIAGVFFLIYAGVGNFSPVLSAIMFMILIVVMPWMVTRSMMFNARNSVYRNVSFRFKEDLKEAFQAFVLWPLAGSLTLGILMPYAIYKQQSFLVNHHRYGTAPFEFSGIAKDYFITFGIIILVFIGCFVGGALLNAILPPSGIFLILAGYLMAFVLFSIKIFNLRFNNTALIHHGFKAEMELMSYTKLVLINTLLTALTLGLFRPFAMVRTAHYKAEHLTFIAEGDLNSFIAEEEEEVSALGQEMGDMFDFDFGL